MVTITRKALEKSLAGINQSIKRSTPAPLIGVVGKDELSFYQEGYLSVWDTVPINRTDSFTEDIKFSVDSNDFHSVVAAMATEDIDVAINEKSLTVKAGKSSVRIPYQDTYSLGISDLPEFKTVIDLPTEFMTALIKARRFVAKTEDRPSLSCLYVAIRDSRVMLIATDAFRMYSTEFDVPTAEGTSLDILIPERCADSMIKIFAGKAVRLGVTERTHIVMSSDEDTTFILTPGFNEVYPTTVFSFLEDTGQPAFVVDRDKFIEAIRLGSSFSAGDKMTLYRTEDGMRMTFNQSRMDSDLYLEGAEQIESFTEATFNPRFLLDCLQSLDKKIQVRQQNEGNGPLWMSSDDNTVTIVHKIQIQ